MNVMNVLDILLHTDWLQILCHPRESCQHQTRAGFLQVQLFGGTFDLVPFQFIYLFLENEIKGNTKNLHSLVGGWGTLAQRTSPTCQTGLDDVYLYKMVICKSTSGRILGKIYHWLRPPRFTKTWSTMLARPTHPVYSVHGGQRPISLEYQIYIPAIDTLVIGIVTTS